MKIFLCFTVKHLYTSLGFISELEGKVKSVIFLAVDHQDINIDDFDTSELDDLNSKLITLDESTLIERFKQRNLLNFSNFLSKNLYVGFKGGYLVSSFIQNEIVKLIPIDLINDEVFLYHDKTFLSKFFINYRNVNLVEDGLANYSEIPVNGGVLKRFIRKVIGLNPKFHILGEGTKVEHVLLTSPERAPSQIRHKCKKLPTLFNEIDKKKKPLFFGFFKLKAIQSTDVTFLTQGLDVAGLCSKEDKHYIYQVILKALVSKYKTNIVIKPHPSETVEEYSNLFDTEQISFLPAKIPFEALIHCFSGPKVQCLSLYSSALTSSHSSITPINLVLSPDLWSGRSKFKPELIISEALKTLDSLV
jgi:hypothetical protein